MAPSWWKHPDNKLKGCQEFLTEACNIVPHHGCCSATPCVLCLEWETYSGTEYGSADFATSSWTGTVGGIAFTSYWERNASNECEYVVTFGGYEVYRATCYEGASCRNQAGEAEATIGTESGTLRWSVYEPRELELIDDPGTGCRDFFCDSCRCSCDCLCVTITDAGSTVRGEICDVAYQCDPPLWAGTIGYYELSLQLGRDASGTCIITPTVNGDELEPVAFPGCASGAATITLYDGTTIAVRCKKCSCEEGDPCCPERCNTVNGESCANPLPTSLECTLTVSTPKLDPITGVPTGCFTCSGTLSLSALNGYIGVVEGTCSGWCGGATRLFQYEVRVTCGLQDDGTISWHVDVRDNLGGDASRLCTNSNEPIVEANLDSSCDPIMLVGATNSFVCTDLTCVIPILDIDEMFGDVIFDVVVWEEP